MSFTTYHTGKNIGKRLIHYSSVFFSLNVLAMSSVTHIFGSRDCGLQIEQTELDAFPESSLVVPPCGDPALQEYLDLAMEHNQLQRPENWESATKLYMNLKEIAWL